MGKVVKLPGLERRVRSGGRGVTRSEFMDDANWTVTMWMRAAVHDIALFRVAPREWRWRVVVQGTKQVLAEAQRSYPSWRAAMADAWQSAWPGE